MPNWLSILNLASAVGSGLIAGAFFAFSAFIMRALGNLPPTQGIAAMQRINQDVINLWFMLPFIGTMLIGLGAIGWSVFNWKSPSAPWLAAGSLLYVVGCFGVTMAFNVPRNDALANVDPASAEGVTVWTSYLKVWTVWNTVRTLASLGAMVCFIVATGWET